VSWLFAYGTLRQREVQLAVFGRELTGEPDALTGFELSTVTIGDPEVVATSGLAEHLILRRSDIGEEITGVAYSVDEADLIKADAYETSAYQRTKATLKSGRRAFVYVAA